MSGPDLTRTAIIHLKCRKENCFCIIAIPKTITLLFHPFFFSPFALFVSLFSHIESGHNQSDTSEHAHSLPSVTSRPYATSFKKPSPLSPTFPSLEASPLPGYIKNTIRLSQTPQLPVGPLGTSPAVSSGFPHTTNATYRAHSPSH